MNAQAQTELSQTYFLNLFCVILKITAKKYNKIK